MIKNILLAGTMMMAAPALAQTAPMTPQTGAVPAQTAPATDMTATAPATTAQQQQPAPATGTAGPAQAAEAAPAASPNPAQPSQDQVAQVVDQNFATYDKDGNGSLSKAEFAAWMTALKAQSPAAGKETPAQATAWNDAAFKQADGDKSATVTKTELTSFLVKGAAQAG